MKNTNNNQIITQNIEENMIKNIKKWMKLEKIQEINYQKKKECMKK